MSTSEKAEKLAKKMKKGEFDFNDLADQLPQMRKMGGMQGVLGMLPGIGKVKDQLAAAGLDDKMLKRQEAIISSMTKQERANPDVINGSRRKRIAAGAGVEVSEVNKLLQDAPPDVGRDEEDGQGRPRHDGRARRRHEPADALGGLAAAVCRPALPPGFGGKR